MRAADVEDVYELSPLQHGILFHSLYGGDTEVYVNQRSFVIGGPLDVGALIAACHDSVRANTTLRTSFHWEGLEKPLQVVHRDAPPVVIEQDWTGTPEGGDRLREFLAEDLATPFDLTAPPLQRLHVIRRNDQEVVLIWTHHLLVLDGWSVPIFVRDVMARYASATMGIPAPPPCPAYREYIGWLQRQDMVAAERFWTGALAPAEGTFAPLLPAVAGAPTTLEERVTTLTTAEVTALRETAARHTVTVNTLLHAAWSVVLEAHGGGPAVTFGVTSSCRPPEIPGIERMVGLFTNTLPVQVTVPTHGPVGPWLRAVQSRYTDIRRHEHAPLARIKQWAGRPSSEPLFESLVIFDNYASSLVMDALGELTFRVLDAVEKTSVPLLLIATQEPTFTIRVRYHRERFDEHAPEDTLACFGRVLSALTSSECASDVAAAARPSAERVEVLGAGPSVRYPDDGRTLIELVDRRARAAPSAVAIRSGGATLTFGELSERIDEIAVALRAVGVRRGSLVGVCVERSPGLLCAILAVLRTGAAYVPIDPATPPARARLVLEEAGSRVVVVQRATATAARAAGARVLVDVDSPGERHRSAPAEPAEPARPDDPAYVIYTSGSTGRPKGVVISHRAIVHRLSWMQDRFRLTTDDRVLLKTPATFDVSVWELFWPLVTGATMVMARPGGHQDAEYLAATIRGEGVTTAHFVPSMLSLFLDEPTSADLPGLRRVVCSGEALAPVLARRVRQQLPAVALHNLYGPTEAAVDITAWDCTGADDDLVPIGRCVPNSRAVVLDEHLRPVADHVPGELYLGGVQLALAYARRPALTASRFVAHPLAGAGGRLYRTGDRARRLPSGALDYLGRLDHQVKINGYRIELGEIEQVLQTHDSVDEAAVVVVERPEGRGLAGFVTAAPATAADPRALTEHLRRHLPAYMVPASVTVLSAMPLSRNGKLDRSALRPSASPVPPSRSRPRTPTEAVVADVFREVLDVAEVDLDTSFFLLGGSSYDAVRAVRRIDGASVGLLGAHPSVGELAAALDGESGQRVLVPLSRPEHAAHTLVCVPFGGGAAISYQDMARALPDDIALWAVSAPGHDGSPDRSAAVEDVAEAVLEAVTATVDGPVSVYGHCAGVGLAVEVARRLEESGRPPERLFVGGAYPFFEPGRVLRTVVGGLSALTRRGLLPVSALTVGAATRPGRDVDRADIVFLRSIGGFDGELDDDELEIVMRTFRSDVAAAADYFTRRWSGGGEPLATPITVLAATDDPLTPDPVRRHASWRRFTGELDLVTIADGGHYFHQRQSDLVADTVVKRVRTRAPATPA